VLLTRSLNAFQKWADCMFKHSCNVQPKFYFSHTAGACSTNSVCMRDTVEIQQHSRSNNGHCMPHTHRDPTMDIACHTRIHRHQYACMWSWLLCASEQCKLNSFATAAERDKERSGDERFMRKATTKLNDTGFPNTRGARKQRRTWLLRRSPRAQSTLSFGGVECARQKQNRNLDDVHFSAGAAGAAGVPEPEQQYLPRPSVPRSESRKPRRMDGSPRDASFWP
jgi:hypothetical protein